ncbi:MAG: winged helix-turn-helix transcriptional regulator [Anaerolineales bacterium]|nr:winged helix-turn-helix transcriptional regulator [Anaerolineales bacterium]
MNTMADETRNNILKIIRTNGKASVNELAAGTGISPISVRHHIAALTADQLIRAEEDRKGIGRPRKLYSLTERALEQTPGRYLRLTNRILERMKSSLPPSELKNLFADIADSMAAELQPRLTDASMEEKLVLLSEYLTEEGFAVELEREDSTIILRELACPYFRISREHPEVCSIGITLISRSLGIPAKRQNWLMNGDAHCSFTLLLDEVPSPTADSNAVRGNLTETQLLPATLISGKPEG